jgi:hypothetical protein
MKTSFLRPLRLLVFFPCYAGNGGYEALSVEVMKWWLPLREKLLADPRIGEVRHFIHGDTPITMTRNLAVQKAMEGGYDLLMMVDSDMQPDCELSRDPQAKPFWDSSFEFVYERMTKGLPTVIFGPYCGGGFHQNVFVFHWNELSNGSGGGTSELDAQRMLSIEPYSRQHAAEKKGIEAVAAGPTGLILYTIDAFKHQSSEAREKGNPFFYYEWKDRAATEKASTEDVTNTRDLAIGAVENGIGDILFCNWDAWAAHIKREHVGKPVPIRTTHAVAKVIAANEPHRERSREAIRKNLEDQGVLFEDEETEEMEAVEPAVAAIKTATYTGRCEVADPRMLAHGRLPTIEAMVARVLSERTRRKGDVVVIYDRDLAVSRLALEAVVYQANLNDRDIRVIYSRGQQLTPEEKAAGDVNGPEIDKIARQNGLASCISGDIRPEGLRWDDAPVHLVIDLRTEPFSEPLAKHAYAYLSLTEPIGWSHREDIHYRQDKSVRAVWFGINEDKQAPKEDVPDGRELAHA